MLTLIFTWPVTVLLNSHAMARQRLGQHFLNDPGWQQRILATLPDRDGDTWIEIGAGQGQMTRLLAARGGTLVAIERDPPLAQKLQAEVLQNPAPWARVEIVSGDVLSCNLGSLVAGRFRVCGNLPYYITSPILHHLFRHAHRIDSIHIVIQREVAERIVARPGSRDYGYLSVICQFYTKPQIVLRIPPGAFRPPPKVNSALLQMTLPGERASLQIKPADETAFLEFVQRCFQQKRRTLRNNLREGRSDAEIFQALADVGARADARAEQLTIAQFAALFARLNK
ncbi:MAG TPA: 16S rRNA (adenine(1518)-N(6)/adenine(1519)-N(6))-dimethyltransferase RsmA [Candidatus Acidoferrales bacterium]|jgi:16S rRNA (adenine1518-N6/adenine1519-N6)-dimethyltransferase|nr:16S rRNA (adenine(1518)-N(6)/adenine(1519)-N(6))-dimethyltransferase RsmA [Candidatus Acidoferrales bacterium]